MWLEVVAVIAYGNEDGGQEDYGDEDDDPQGDGTGEEDDAVDGQGLYGDASDGDSFGDPDDPVDEADTRHQDAVRGDLRQGFDDWLHTRGLFRRDMGSLNEKVPANPAEALIYGSKMRYHEMRDLAFFAFGRSGLSSYLCALGKHVRDNFCSFGCNNLSFGDLALAATLAQEYLEYRQFARGDFEAVINSQELQACIVAMANILVAFQRRDMPGGRRSAEPAGGA